ncbi:MAG: CHAT domain-containing protein [Brasilonema angustatum HA4187-MV1]|jgi:CHAT domain-containing protein|nr:CHAT domain-containing protein [Brasilonema angustatum HA4187-MV1]
MPSQHRTSILRRSLKLIFLFSLVFILWLSHVPLSPLLWGFGEVVSVETRDVRKLVQQIEQREQALAYHRQTKDWLQVGQMLIQQAQAYMNLGKPKRAIALLDSVLQIARTHNNSVLEALALSSRGEAYQQKGDYKHAITDLQASLNFSDVKKNLMARASVFQNLGTAYIRLAQVNYLRAESAVELGDDDVAYILKKQGLDSDFLALEYLEKSLVIAHKQNDNLAQIRLLINSVTPAHHTKQSDLAKTNLQEALVLLKQLPDSPEKVYASIELAKIVQLPSDNFTLSLVKCQQPIVEIKYIPSLHLLQQAVSIAQGLADDRALSFALTYLAHFYECQHDYTQALKLTREAQFLAENNVNARENLYLCQWQFARIFKAQNKLMMALTAYEAAINTFKNLRHPHVIFDSYLQDFSHENTNEKILRELIEVKLSLTGINLSKNNSHDLTEILNKIENLKLAEVQNYLGEDSDLILVNKKVIDSVETDNTTAFFHSIILEDRLAIIISLPDNKKYLRWIFVDRKSLRQEINEFRRGLEKRSNIIYNPQQAQKLYDWIIRPFVKDLDSLHIKTLIFINDGILGSVPMTALHDGKEFLVQRYAISNACFLSPKDTLRERSIATTSATTLINAKKVNRKNLRMLAMGLTKDAIVDGRKYEALSNVKQEINQVTAQIPGSKQLLDDNFTYTNLQTELRQTFYPIIHIATHGEFSAVSEDTFLITGNNGKLTMTDLYTLIRNTLRGSQAVELLTLTACDTAIGDDRIPLGLAGSTVNAGVKSAFASLWSINDAATVTFVTKFYAEWYENGLSKAEALQRVQKELITNGKKYAHPYYWAPFILVGNWF